MTKQKGFKNGATDGTPGLRLPSKRKWLTKVVTAALMISATIPIAQHMNAVYAATGQWTDITNGAVLAGPNDIAVDGDGNLYVTAGNNAILMKGIGSNYWFNLGAGVQFNNPEGITVDHSGNVYVVNSYVNEVDEYVKAQHGWVRIPGNGALNQPNRIAVDSSGDVYVTNDGNNTVLEHVPGSNAWTDITNGAPFLGPVGIAVDGNGNLFVADHPSGQVFERIAGSSSWTDIRVGLPDDVWGIAVDVAGNVYVTHRSNSVQGSDSVQERVYGTNTWTDLSGNVSLAYAGIAVDSCGDVFVTDHDLSILQEYIVQPSAPTGLTSNNTTATSTTLTWNPVQNATSYKVYLNGNPITTVTGPTFTVGGLTPATSFTVAVGAVNSSGESPTGAPLTVVTSPLASVPSAPTGLSASGTTSTLTVLSWDSVSGATSYNVYENGTKIANVTGVNHTVNGLTPGSSYTLTVSAVNSSGESPQSNPLSVDTIHIGTATLKPVSTNVLSGDTESLSGVVSDVYGAPVPNAVVQLSSTIGTWSTSGTTSESVTADANGAFSAIWQAPTVSNATSATLTATVHGATGTPATVAMNVAPAPKISTSALQNAFVGRSYAQTIDATGGFTPYTWSVTTGMLPSGLSLDPSTGTISGTPQQTGSSTFGVQVQDSIGDTATQTFTINTLLPLSLGTSSLSDTTVGSSYAQALRATGGIQPYTWSITSGSLPNGLSLEPSTGIITGTTTQAGTSSFTIQVKDSSGDTVSGNLFIKVGTPLTVSSQTEARVKKAYKQTLTAAGGTAPYTWSVNAGSLPKGLTLNPSTGVISGTPVNLGTFAFSVKVQDSSGAMAILSLSIAVSKHGDEKSEK